MRILKSEIQRREISQARAAKELNVSLPTLKRWLSGEGVSLEVFVKLLEYLELSLSDIEVLLPNEASRTFEYTEQQEKLFLKHPSCIAYFDRLMAGDSVKKIQQKSQISNLSTRKYLKLLEQVGLIEVHANDKIKIIPRGEPRWKKNGALSKRYKKQILEEYLQKAEDSPLSLRFGMIKINDADYKLLKTKIEELNQFVRESEHRSKLRGKYDLNAGVLLSAHPFEWDLLTKITDI